jgi:hypothetical protein
VRVEGREGLVGGGLRSRVSGSGSMDSSEGRIHRDVPASRRAPCRPLWRVEGGLGATRTAPKLSPSERRGLTRV